MAALVEPIDTERLDRLLAASRDAESVQDRIERISRALLGAPYREQPLIGSPSEREVFVPSIEAFDCVTYIETVLALAGSRSRAGFRRMLRRIRYADGRLEWRKRNHYMTAWIRNNQREGLVVNLTRGPRVIERERRLSVLAGLEAKTITLRCIPKRDFLGDISMPRTGDILFFASTRSNLDVFHCGILVRSDASLRLRHAARSRGEVVEQDLGEFIGANRMAGVIPVRPKLD